MRGMQSDLCVCVCACVRMSGRRSLVDEDTEEVDGGPGLAYMPFVVMDDLLDKLKLLDYDKEFLIDLKMKPLNR